MDSNGNSFDSEWFDTKVEAIEYADRIFKNPKHDCVNHFMIYNNLNRKLSFKYERSLN